MWVTGSIKYKHKLTTEVQPSVNILDECRLTLILLVLIFRRCVNGSVENSTALDRVRVLTQIIVYISDSIFG